MIWFIIVTVLLALSLLLLLSGCWEIEEEAIYSFDEKGTHYVQVHKVRDTSDKAVVLEFLKTKYKDQYDRYHEYNLKRYPNSVDSHDFEDFAYSEIPATLKVKRHISVRQYWPEVGRFIGGCVLTGIFLIIGLIMGGTAAGCKVTWAIQAKTAEYETQITELENNKQYILTYYSSGVNKDIDISSTNIPAVIKEHNAEVKELVKRIKVDRINLNNPWVGSWVNPACENVDLLRIEATYINSLS